MLNKELY